MGTWHPGCLSVLVFRPPHWMTQVKQMSIVTNLHLLVQKSEKWEDKIQPESEEFWAQLLPPVLQQLRHRAQKELLLNICLPNLIQILLTPVLISKLAEVSSGKHSSSLAILT